jgi:bifunctional ADP-heptose synthase (sugar kinase/adenylyltransferase)
MNREKVIVTSGDFDILNLKDVQFLQKCKLLGDWLVVGLHSDVAVHMRTGTLNNEFSDRLDMLSEISVIDEILRFNDADGTSCGLIKLVKLCYPGAAIVYVSKQEMQNTPERKIRGVSFVVID